MADPLPRSDMAMLTFTDIWANAFASDAAVYGVSEDDASVYIALQSQFAETLARWQAADTGGRTALIAKDESRQSLVKATRSLFGQIRARANCGDISDGDLSLIGIAADGRAHPRKAAWPLAGAPLLSVSILRPGVVRVRVRESIESTRRTWPPGVRGLFLFRAIADELPMLTREAWRGGVGSTRQLFDVELNESSLAFGSRVWFAARWNDPQMRETPFSQPQMIRTTWEGPLKIGQNLAA